LAPFNLTITAAVLVSKDLRFVWDSDWFEAQSMTQGGIEQNAR
jgi:hypothetical protein